MKQEWNNLINQIQVEDKENNSFQENEKDEERINPAQQTYVTKSYMIPPRMI